MLLAEAIGWQVKSQCQVLDTYLLIIGQEYPKYSQNKIGR